MAKRSKLSHAEIRKRIFVATDRPGMHRLVLSDFAELGSHMEMRDYRAACAIARALRLEAARGGWR